MEVQIRKFRNEVQDEINETQKLIKRAEENIQRLKSNKQSFDPQKLIERNKQDLETHKKALGELNKKLNLIETGEYEKTLKTEMEANKLLIKSKSETTKKKKQNATGSRVVETKTTTTTDAKTDKQPNKQTNKYNNFRFPYERDIEKEMRNAEKYYFKDCASVPDYMREKLDNMSNNMGYIWKDIWCFGSKPVHSNRKEYTLFEKRNGKFLVHHYDMDRRIYNLYEKDNNNNKKLISSKNLHRLV